MIRKKFEAGFKAKVAMEALKVHLAGVSKIVVPKHTRKITLQ